jgi:hypothetical protein
MMRDAAESRFFLISERLEEAARLVSDCYRGWESQDLSIRVSLKYIWHDINFLNPNLLFSVGVYISVFLSPEEDLFC